jgi:hypothetical protein
MRDLGATIVVAVRARDRVTAGTTGVVNLPCADPRAQPAGDIGHGDADAAGLLEPRRDAAGARSRLRGGEGDRHEYVRQNTFSRGTALARAPIRPGTMSPPWCKLACGRKVPLIDTPAPRTIDVASPRPPHLHGTARPLCRGGCAWPVTPDRSRRLAAAPPGHRGHRTETTVPSSGHARAGPVSNMPSVSHEPRVSSTRRARVQSTRVGAR